jgi:DNA-binding protein HU-beta
MTKAELIESISERTNGISASGIDAVIQALVSEIHKQDVLYIQGLGTFRHSVLSATTYRNPRTGELVEVPKVTTLRFKASLRTASYPE